MKMDICQGHRKKLWALLMAIVMIASVVYIKMPNAKADDADARPQLKVNLNMKGGLIASEEQYGSVGADENGIFTVSAPAVTADAADVYAFDGWDYNHTILTPTGGAAGTVIGDDNSQVSRVTGAALTGTVGFVTKAAVDASSDLSLQAHWRLLAPALSVSAEAASGEGTVIYDSDSGWTNQDVTVSAVASVAVSGASVVYQTVTGESADAIAGAVWDEEKVPYSYSDPIVVGKPAEGALVSKLIFKITDSLGSEPYIAESPIIMQYVHTPAITVDVTGNAVKDQDKYWYQNPGQVQLEIEATGGAVGINRIEQAQVRDLAGSFDNEWKPWGNVGLDDMGKAEKKLSDVTDCTDSAVKVGFRVTDQAGNQALSNEVKFDYDGEGPALTLKAVLQNSYYVQNKVYTSGRFLISAQADDGGKSGLAGVAVSAGGITASADAASCEAVVEKNAGDGSYPLMAAAADKLGNESHLNEAVMDGTPWTADAVVLDTKAPHAEAFEVSANAVNGIYQKEKTIYAASGSSVTLNLDLTAEDAGAGIRTLQVLGKDTSMFEAESGSAVDSVQVTGSAVYHNVTADAVIGVSLVDNVSNEAVVTGYSIQVDAAAPKPTKCEIKGSVVKKIWKILTFNLFAKEEIKIILDADDQGGSGVASLELYDGDEQITPVLSDEGYQYTIPAKSGDVNKKENLRVKVIDRVGNETKCSFAKFYKIANRSDYRDWTGEVAVDQKAPVVIEEVTTSGVSYENDGVLYVPTASGVSVKYKAEDDGSYLRRVQMALGGDTYDMSDVIYTVSCDAAKTESTDGAVDVSGYLTADPDKAQIFWVRAYDNAGNYREVSRAAAVDTLAPEVTGFVFDATAASAVTEESYGYFFQKDVKLTINTADRGNVHSGVKQVRVITLAAVDGTNGTTAAAVDVSGSAGVTLAVDASGSAVVTIPAGFKGQIYACAEDNVGNRSDTVHPYGVVVEAKDQHIDCATAAAVLLSETDKRTKDQKKLYRGAVEVSMAAADPISGIQKVEWSVYADGNTIATGASAYALTGGGAETTGSGSSDDWITESDKNLIKRIQKSIHVDTEADDIYVELKFIDHAGYPTSVFSEHFSIDRTAPDLTKEPIKLKQPHYTNPDQAKAYYAAGETVSLVYGADDTCLDGSQAASGSGIHSVTLSVNREGETEALGSKTILYSTEKKELAVSNQGITAEEIAGTELTEGIYTVTGMAVDLAGNQTAYEPVVFYVDESVPVVEAFALNTQEASYTDQGKIWYNSYERIKIQSLLVRDQDFKETSSGVKNVTLNSIDADGITSAAVEASIDTMDIKSIFSQKPKNEDGSVNLKVTAADHVDNVMAEQSGLTSSALTVYVDDTAPCLTKFTFKEGEKEEHINIGEKNPEWQFFMADTDLTVEAVDKNASAGIASFCVTLDGVFAEEKTEQKVITQAAVEGKANFTIPAGFKGKVIVKAIDCVGHESEEVLQKVITETESQHAEAATGSAVIETQTTARTVSADGTGIKLYQASHLSVRVNMNAADSISGIQSVSWKVFVDGSSVHSGKTQFTIDGSGAKPDGEDTSAAWTVKASGDALITDISKQIEIKDEGDDIYIELTFQDNAGHTVETITSEHFSIDKTAPKIEQAQLSDTEEDHYYKDSDDSNGKIYYNPKDQIYVQLKANDITLSETTKKNVCSGVAGIQVAVSRNGIEIEIGQNGRTQYSVNGIKDTSIKEPGGKHEDPGISINRILSDSLGEKDLAEGIYDITITVTDVAGNQSEQKLQFAVDTNPGEVTGYRVRKMETTADKILRILTFGIYSNADVEVTFLVRDNTITGNNSVNTGIQDVIVRNGKEDTAGTSEDDARITGKPESGSFGKDYARTEEGTYSVVLSMAGLYDLNIHTIDNVGNTSETVKLSELSIQGEKGEKVYDEFGNLVDKIQKNELIKEADPPVISDIEFTGYKSEDGNHKKWFSSYQDILVSYQVDDSGQNAWSGLHSVTARRDRRVELGGDWSAVYKTQKVGTHTVSKAQLAAVSPNTAAIPTDGSVTIEVAAEDNAGNRAATKSAVAYVDAQKPRITEFRFHAEDPAESIEKSGIMDNPAVDKEDYGFFFRKATSLTVYAEDKGASSGIKQIKFMTQDVNGEIRELEPDGPLEVVSGDSASGYTAAAVFTVPAEFKGQIYAMVTDNTEKDSEGTFGPNKTYVGPSGVVVETQDSHNANASIEIIREAAGKKELEEGIDLYHTGVNVTLRVKDSIAGIEQIQWSVLADGVPVQTGTADIGIDAGLPGENDIKAEITDHGITGSDIKWQVEQCDQNLVTQMSRPVYVADNAKKIQIEVSFTDRAGNRSQAPADTFSIDTIAPKIKQAQLADTKEDHYYTDSDGKIYYNKDDQVYLQVETDDATPSAVTGQNICSGIDQIQVTVLKNNQKIGENIWEYSDQGVRDASVKEPGKKHKGWGISLNDITKRIVMEEGAYQVVVVVTDVAGNRSEQELQFAVDTNPGEITGYRVRKMETTADKVLRILTFGIYSNADVEVTFLVRDNTITGNNSVNTGIQDVIVRNGKEDTAGTSEDDARITGKPESGSFGKDYARTEEGTYSVVLSMAGLYDLNIHTIDNVGNTSETVKLSELSIQGEKGDKVYDEFGNLVDKIQQNELIIEANPPVISDIEFTGYKSEDGNHKKWFSSYQDILVSYQVDDSGQNAWSGLHSVTARRDRDEHVELGGDWSAVYKTQKVGVHTVNQAQLAAVSPNAESIPADGSVTIEVTAEDNAGNKAAAKSAVAYVDAQIPRITEFRFDAADAEESIERSGTIDSTAVEKTDYGFFFRQSASVTVYAEDKGASSGIKQIRFITQDLNGAVRELAPNSALQQLSGDSVSGYTASAVFTVPAEFKGQIYAMVTDYTEKDSSGTFGPNQAYVGPSGVITETQESHNANASIEIIREETTLREIDERNDLYQAGVNVTIRIKDPIVGIEQIHWSVTADGEPVQTGTADIDIDAGFTREGGIRADIRDHGITGSDTQWRVEGVDQNLVTQMSRQVYVADNARKIQVEVTFTDRAGNLSVAPADIFSIDMTAPRIDVAYINNSPDGANTSYFKDMRTAVITVTERNFDPSAEYVDMGRITNTDGPMPAVSGWICTRDGDSANKDDRQWECQVYYEADGDYTFGIGVRDHAGYSNEGINYAAGTAAPEQFTIDRTLPVMNIAYNNNNLNNGNYSRETRTATITVHEHNFNPDRFRLTARAQDGPASVSFPTMSSFSTNGDVHTATIRFEQDAEYIYSIAYTDMAGNEAAPLAEEDFYVDLKAPVITVQNGEDMIFNSGSDAPIQKMMFAKGENISPIVDVIDRNFDESKCSVTLQRKGGAVIDAPAATGTRDEGSFKRYTFQALEDTFEMDGAYQLLMTVTDRAGNVTTQQWDYVVNRHGTKIESGDIAKYNNCVYTGKELIVNGKKGQNFKLTLISAHKLTKSMLRVMLGTMELDEDLFELSEPQEIENGMYRYILEIKDAAFTKDGDYRLAVYTTSESGLEQELLSFWDESITIIVDKTDPVCYVRDVEEDGVYKVQEKTFKIVADDRHLKKIRVSIDGKQQEYSTEDLDSIDELEQTGDSEYTLTCTLKAANAKQTLEISCEDIAEHETKKFTINGKDGEKLTERAAFLISADSMVIFMAAVKENLLWIILGILVIAGAVAGIIIWRRKKRNSAAAQ